MGGAFGDNKVNLMQQSGCKLYVSPPISYFSCFCQHLLCFILFVIKSKNIEKIVKLK